MSRKIICLLTVLVLMLSIFTGCGSSSASSSETEPPAAAVPTDASKNSTSKSSAKPSAVFDSKTDSGEIALGEGSGNGSSGQSDVNAILSERKVIRNSNITVEVEDFDVSYGKIKTLINGIGYVQDANIKTEKQYEGTKEKLLKRGIIVIRVDKLKFEDVISGIRGLGLLVEENVKSDDVTDKYFDTESRVRLLKFEQSRLEEYLKKITDPDVIFKTEDKLTDIMHQIESLTGTLKKWDDLVQLSTITINMSENKAGSSIPEVKDSSYGSKLSDGFTESLKGVVNFLGGVLVVIVKVLPVLVLLGLLGLIGYVTYRKFFANKNNNTNNKNNNNNLNI